jgi:hypothetical protein
MAGSVKQPKLMAPSASSANLVGVVMRFVVLSICYLLLTASGVGWVL